MKKSISISGIVCANLMMFGSMFKVMHWPGASIMLILAVVLFCFLFLPMALMSNYKRQEETRLPARQEKYLALHVTTFFVFFIGMMGVLFKVMHWPGAGIFLVLGIPLPFVVFLPVYLYQTRKEKKDTLNYSGIMFGLIFLAVFSVLLALNVSKNVLENSAMNMGNTNKFNSFTEAKLKNFNVESKVKQQSDELYTYVENLKCMLLTRTENNLCAGNKLSPDSIASEIDQKENTVVPMKLLLGTGGGNVMEDLKLKINSFRETVLASEKINPDLSELINGLFDVSDKKSDEEDYMIPWESREFKSYQLIFVLDVLSQIQSNVRLVESELVAVK